VSLQPGLEDSADLQRQAQQHIAGTVGTLAGGAFQDALQLHVVDRRDHRRRQHRHRDAGTGQPRDGVQPPLRRGRAGFQDARQMVVQRGDGQADPRQPARRHAGQDVRIAQHAGGFGDHRHGVVEALQHLQHRAGQLQRALHRLIGIGVGAQRHRRRLVARLAQGGFQQLRHLRLEQQLGFEIQARGKAEIGVGRPREAINAAMLAAPVRVDGAVKADVG
jgi:hypothetical protein